jgi:tyrosine-specific transport protein
MNNKLLGCTLLVIGTSIGGGMLALPVVTASGGFWKSSLLLIFAWFVMTLGALYMAEVNSWLHQDNNIVSMAKQTLGKIGQVVAWLTYLGLLYALMSAYIAGGSGVVQSLFQLMSVKLASWIAALMFTIILALIVWRGVASVDKTNRALMSVKLIAFLGLVILIAPHINWPQLHGGHAKTLYGAITVVITSFGFAGSVPTFCSYLNYDMKQIRKAILIGSVVTLVAYLVWDAVVQGTILSQTLTRMGNSGNTTEALTQTLSHIASSAWVSSFTHLFTSICMFTSFIGVALGLSDFLADGMGVAKNENKGLVYGVTFIPPLLITLFYPQIFVTALSFAGIFCLILLMLLPALMSWYGRYKREINNKVVHVWGGKLLLRLEIVVAIALVAIAILQKVSF